MNRRMGLRVMVTAMPALWLTLPPLAAAQNVTQLPINQGNMSANLTIPDRLQHTTPVDREFAGGAAASAERQAVEANVALRGTRRQDVKQVAAILRSDGKRIGRALEGIVPEVGSIAAAQRDAVAQPADDTYSDRAFIAEQIEIQRNQITLFKQECQRGGDGGLKNLARLSLPGLQRSLQALQALPAE